MRIFLTGCLILISFASVGQSRRAQNLIEKQKYESAFQLLKNELAKDTISASIPFVLAKLYVTPHWSNYQLDSAYYFSMLSLARYGLLNEKRLDRHIKEGFGKTRLLSLKGHIDSLAFDVAKAGGTELDYQTFIKVHTDAHELDSAIYYRNEEAYKTASIINSLQSYKQFLDAYPKADDWAKANAKYQRMLYKQSTINGKLEAFKAFVSLHPSSPYYEKAVNHIYAIEIGQNTTQVMLAFIRRYPHAQAAQRVIGLLYHTHLVQEPASSFTDKFPSINISDSLVKVIKMHEKTLLPMWSGTFFQMKNLEQKVVIDSLYTIDKKTIDTDFMLVKKGNGQALIGKTGNSFYTGTNIEFQKEDRGFVFLKKQKATIIVHKNGDRINGGNEAFLLGAYIAYQSNQKWGVKSITNLELLPPIYDRIWVENGLILLKKKDKTVFIKEQILHPALDGNLVALPNGVDDYEWLTDHLLWVIKDDKEGLFSASLKELVPLGNYQIDLAGKGWSIMKKSDIAIPKFSADALVNFEENKVWQIGTLKDSLLIKYNYTSSFSPLHARLLGPSAIIMHWADTSFVYLSDTIRFYKPSIAEVKPLLNQENEVFYYEIIEGKNKVVVNYKGKKLDLPTYKKIIPLNKFFFQLEIGKSKQLFSAEGLLIMDGFEGSSLINDTTISILNNQQFGLIQPFDSVQIGTNYSSKLVPIADSLWVVSEAGYVGIINNLDSVKLPIRYEEINYWTNGLLFVKRNLKWHIFDLKTLKFVEEGIVNYNSITRNRSPKISYQKGVGIGIFDSKKGIVLKPTYTAISLQGTLQEPYYQAEKHVEEAGLHIMLYYNMDGDLLFQNILNEAAFSALYASTEE